MPTKNESLWLASGIAGENQARTLNLPIEFTRVVIGDALGTYPALDESRTALVNEVLTGEITGHQVDPNDANQRIIEMNIPPTANLDAVEILLYAKYGDTEFAHTYFRLATPFSVRSIENGGSQARLKYTIRVSEYSDFSIFVVPDLAYVTNREFNDKFASAANDLTGVVDSKITDINTRMVEKEQAFDNYLLSARDEYPIYRQSKNQFGNLTGDSLDYFARNNGFTLSVSHYRTIAANIAWQDRDVEEQEILIAMGKNGSEYFKPEIRVMKLSWSGYDADNHSSYTIFPDPVGNNSGYCTVASYAKLLSGDIKGSWLQDVNSDWGLCGANYPGKQGSYIHAHPHAYSPSGEVLFIWPAIVSGYVPLDRSNPRWGYYPSLFGDGALDTSPGA